MYVNVQLDDAPSIRRPFVKVQTATFVGAYYESINAWLSDPPDPRVHVIRSPDPADGPYQLGRKPLQPPLQGAIPLTAPTTAQNLRLTSLCIIVFYFFGVILSGDNQIFDRGTDLAHRFLRKLRIPCAMFRDDTQPRFFASCPGKGIL